MKQYSLERKEAALKKMMPPNNMSINQLSLDMGMTESTLYNWRKQATNKGQLVPGDGNNAEQWSSANKFALAKVEARKDKNQISSLEKELRRKDKVLAETAALLVLRKKANAI
ncbi:MAG: transposase [Paraglaciecola sp.]|jgi:transposase